MEKMSDTALNKACADALRLHSEWNSYMEAWMVKPKDGDPLWIAYDPLHDDAQAMALVKKFKLQIARFDYDEQERIKVIPFGNSHYGSVHEYCGPNLNRAICECIANLHNAKLKETV